MSTVTTRAVTPEEFLQMGSDGKGFELVDGELREKIVSTKSSRVGGRVFRWLDEYADRVGGGWALPPEAGFQCFPAYPNRVRKPDAAFLAADRLTVERYEEDGFCQVCPDLVVEVNSPNDTASEVIVKIQDWLAAGVRVVWEVDPEARLVFAHTDDGVTRFLEADTLVCEPVLPGFAVPVADLFKLPGG